MSTHALRSSGSGESCHLAILPFSDRPIDLVHLSRQTLGDRGLEIELLGLFERQAAQVMERLQQPNGNGERRWRHDLAHMLKGSARAVGAGRVASCAQTFEEALFSAATDSEVDAILAELALAVEEARVTALDFMSDA